MRFCFASVVALLAMEGFFSLKVGPLPFEALDPALWHVLRYISASLLVILLPGLPFSRILLSATQTTPIKLLGLAFVLNTLFYALLIRALRFLDILPTAGIVFSVTAAASLLGLLGLLLSRRALSIPLRRQRLLVYQLAIALVIVLFYYGANHQDINRPSYRHFEGEEADKFLAYEQVGGASLRFAEGFNADQQGPRLWRLIAPSGVMKIASGGPGAREGAFPLRLIVFGPGELNVRICAEGLPCGEAPIRKTYGILKTESYFPRFQASMIVMDLPPSCSSLRLEVSAPREEDPILFEDHSNLSEEERNEFFFARNRIAPLALLSEAFQLMDAGWEHRDFLLDHGDFILGYLLHYVVEILGGQSCLGINLFFLASLVICFLVGCEILQDLGLAHSRWSVIFPALASLEIMITTVGEVYRTFLPDIQFTAFLLIAVMLMQGGRPWLFLLATIPAALARSTGIYLLSVFLLVNLVMGPRRRFVLKLGLVWAAMWVALFIIMNSAKISEGMMIKSLHGFLMDYAGGRLDQVMDPEHGGPWNFFKNLFCYSGGLCVFLLFARSRTGVLLLAMVVSYSLMLMMSSYQPYYWFVPLVFLSAVGAGAAVLDRPGFPGRLLSPLAIIVAAAMLMFYPFFIR